MIKDIHKADYAELVNLVSAHTYLELREILDITSEDDEWVDFNFKSLVATISKSQPPYLTGWCDLWDSEGNWIDSQQMGQKVIIKQ